VRKKPTFEEGKRSTELINGIKCIFKESVTDLQAKTLLNTTKGDLNTIKEKYEVAKVTPGIKNIVGWMIDAIKKDYQAPIGKIKVHNFNDYEQRTYDYNDLERKLLGWDKNEKDDAGKNFNQGNMNV